MKSPGSGYEKLWSGTPNERLKYAVGLDEGGRANVLRMLLDGCPKRAWPYGCGTSVNPWVVYLGPSPGVSPAAGDMNYNIVRKGDPPTFGRPHATMVYRDTRGFFERLRLLTTKIIRKETGGSLTEHESWALAGIMNLDSGASGNAGDISFSPSFSKWALDVTFNRLMPRFVVGLGLSTILAKAEKRWLCDEFTRHVGSKFHSRHPQKSVPFRGYTEKHFEFRIWQVGTQFDGTPVHFVLFPQHPCRSPMTNPQIWQAAADEFVEIFYTDEE